MKNSAINKAQLKNDYGSVSEQTFKNNFLSFLILKAIIIVLKQLKKNCLTETKISEYNFSKKK